MEEKRHNSNPPKSNSAVIIVIIALVTIPTITYMASRINFIRQQLVNQQAQILELKNSKDNLEQQLQDANLKLAALTSANNYLEKNAERLAAIRDFLQDQLSKINEQLAQQEKVIAYQEEIITSLKEANSKLDTVISQIGYLYLESEKTASSKDKGRVNVYLSPEEGKQPDASPVK